MQTMRTAQKVVELYVGKFFVVDESASVLKMQRLSETNQAQIDSGLVCKMLGIIFEARLCCSYIVVTAKLSLKSMRFPSSIVVE